MSPPIKRYQLENYRKALLNRVTSNITFMEYVENCLAREDEAAKHSFHKIMVHNWSGTANQLFDTLTEYFGATFIPVMYVSQGDITSFYTSSLGVMLKMIKLDFMFPFQRNMFNIDILFNDRNSAETFDNAITIEDIVCSIVSNRINEKFELDLSNFCNDPEFTEKQINFYKINLLSHFKILMLRMGRDTRSLNLSNNNLSQVPVDILNFFIKGELIAINLSYNNIPSLAEVLRVSSRIEKLWIEGNPLCDELDPVDYVKNITMKFPRLKELDGVNLNRHGFLPYFQNFLVTPDRRTKMFTEKFLTLFFTNYEGNRRRLVPMYDADIVFTLSTDFGEAADQAPPAYTSHTRNLIDPDKRYLVVNGAKIYKKKDAAIGVMSLLPAVTHDPSTFTVDVLYHHRRTMMIVVDGIYKEKNENASLPDRVYQFRRTFVFKIITEHPKSLYTITNEMFSVQFANKEQIQTSFKFPVRNMNELALINPDSEDIETIVKIFTHITQLKRHEVEARLKLQNWDIRKALALLIAEVKDNKITADKFIEDDDFSDSSSLIDDEID